MTTLCLKVGKAVGFALGDANRVATGTWPKPSKENSETLFRQLLAIRQALKLRRIIVDAPSNSARRVIELFCWTYRVQLDRADTHYVQRYWAGGQDANALQPEYAPDFGYDNLAPDAVGALAILYVANGKPEGETCLKTFRRPPVHDKQGAREFIRNLVFKYKLKHRRRPGW